MQQIFKLSCKVKESLGRKKFSSPGFSLLEMSVVLIVMGVMAGLTFPLLTQYLEQTRHKITREHQREVMKALEAYCIDREALPVPGNPQTGETLSLATREAKTGIVPYRELGLPEEMVKDGFGHYMTYAPAPFLTNIGSAQGIKDKPEGPKIKIQDEKGKEVLEISDANAHNCIAYVLISYGPEGKGAYTGKNAGERFNKASLSDDEKTNCQNDVLVFKTRPYSTNPKNLFRHRIVWETHVKLVKATIEFGRPQDPQASSPVHSTQVNKTEKEGQKISLPIGSPSSSTSSSDDDVTLESSPPEFSGEEKLNDPQPTSEVLPPSASNDDVTAESSPPERFKNQEFNTQIPTEVLRPGAKNKAPRPGPNLSAAGLKIPKSKPNL